MTIAVAVKKGNDLVLAADSQTHFGDQREGAPNIAVNKIVPLGGSLLAVSGWALYANILEDYGQKHPLAAGAGCPEVFRYFLKFWKGLHTSYPFVNDQCGADDDHTPFGDLDSEFLVVNRRGIFKVCANMSIVEFQHYATIGSGGDYAMGTLFALFDSDLNAEALARRAIEAAIHFDVHCGGAPCVTTLKLDPRFRAKAAKPPKPYKGSFKITNEFIDEAKR